MDTNTHTSISHIVLLVGIVLWISNPKVSLVKLTEYFRVFNFEVGGFTGEVRYNGT